MTPPWAVRNGGRGRSITDSTSYTELSKIENG